MLKLSYKVAGAWVGASKQRGDVSVLLKSCRMMVRITATISGTPLNADDCGVAIIGQLNHMTYLRWGGVYRSSQPRTLANAVFKSPSK